MVEQLPVYVSTDPDSGDPSAIAQFSVADGDVTPSTIFPTPVRSAIQEVVDSSAKWDEGGAASVPGSISGLWQGASLYAQGASANIGATSAISTVSGNIATNATNIATLDTSVGALNLFPGLAEASAATLNTSAVALNLFPGAAEASAATLNTNIGTNTTNITANDTDIAANTASIGVNSDNVGVMGGTSAILDLPLAGNVLTVSGLVLTEGAGGNIDMGDRSIKNCTQLSATRIKTDLTDELSILGNTADSYPLLKGYGDYGLDVSAAEVSGGILLPVIFNNEPSSVYVSGFGPGDDKTKANITGNNIFLYDYVNTRFIMTKLPIVPKNSGGEPLEAPTVVTTDSNITRVEFEADLSSAKNKTSTFDGNTNIGSDLGVSGDTYMTGDLTVTGTPTLNKTLVVSSQNSVATMTGALPTIDSLSCPSPPGAFCFLSAVGDGTAGTSEISFGAGTAVQGVSSVGRGGEDGYYLWNNEDSELAVSADGVYKVEFVGVTEVGAAITITVSFYTGSTLVHRFDIRVHSVTDPHNLVGTWVGFARTTEPLSVTINSGSGDNAQLMQGSTVFVQRLA